MIHLITYGDSKFTESKARIMNDAKALGWFDEITLYGPEDIDADFKERFKSVLELPRGGGYWIWKPYFIKKHLEKIKEDDILIYIDAGCHINPGGAERFKEYMEIVKNSEEGCLSFQLVQLMEFQWTVKEVFQHFNISNQSNDIIATGQIMATVKIYKKNANSVNIVYAWLNTLYQNPLLFTDHYNKQSQCQYFIDNRHDQSISSVLSKLYKSVIIEDETYFAEGFECEKAQRCPFWASRIRR